MWDLDNGWQAAIQYNDHYGEYVSSLSKDGKTWYASDGLDNRYGLDPDPIMQRVFKDHIALPDFAREWLNGGDFHTTQNLVRPKFTKVFDNSNKCAKV